MLRWRSDPVGFCKTVLGFHPYPYQEKVLRAFADDPSVNPLKKKRLVWHAGHNVGKTATEAALALWYSMTHPYSIVVDTAPTYERQVVKIFWGELKKWAAKLDEPGAFELQKSQLVWNAPTYWPKSKTPAGKWIITGESASQKEKIAGYHSPFGVLIIIDEASGVEDDIFEALEGALSGKEDIRVLVCGNPTKASGEFYRAMYENDPKRGYKDTYLRVITSSWESPNVDTGWCADMKRKYGEESAAYRSRVLGLAPKDDPDSLIPLHLILEAKNRWLRRQEGQVKPEEYIRPSGFPKIGVDVARFGDDDSVIAARYGNHLSPLVTHHGFDSIAIADKVGTHIRDIGGGYDSLAIDGIGYGAGVVDQLKFLKYNVRDVNVSTKASDPDEFINLRAELAWKMRDWFMSERAEIPDDKDLIEELVGLKVTFESGKTQLETKEAMKRRLDRSPDRADALMLTFAGPAFVDWSELAKDYKRGPSNEFRYVESPYAGGVCL